MRKLRTIIVAITLLCAAGAAQAQHHEHPAGDATQLGKVQFVNSCSAAVQEEFNRGVAMLHSFWYEAAREAFAGVAAKDPQCAMAHWGVAMTYFTPVWVQSDPRALAAGRAAVERAKAIEKVTPRERDFITGIEAFYRDFENLNHRARVLAYEQAMSEAYARNPHDMEATAFYALALIAVGAATPQDTTYAWSKKAGDVALKLFAAQPLHPGAAHYVIHSYDFPGLAERGLDAARRYAKIAPDSPHALHMPSHIFTRLGYWQESILSNADSAAAGKKHKAVGDELHAIDYLVYAHLQQGNDAEAERLARAMPTIRVEESHTFAGMFALASVPGRITLERRRWKDAAALQLPKDFPAFPHLKWTEANLSYAVAIGGARSGDLAAARRGIEQLAALHKTLADSGDTYWPQRIEAQRAVAAAWVSFAEGKKDEALAMMRKAADMEDSMEKHPVTPSAVLPARELLGDMLLEAGQPAEALAAYEATLKVAPRRFNALYGAGRAAEKAGQAAQAASHYRALVELCGGNGGARAELRDAKAFLAGSKQRASRK